MSQKGREGRTGRRERVAVIPLHGHSRETLLISIASPCFV